MSDIYTCGCCPDPIITKHLLDESIDVLQIGVRAYNRLKMNEKSTLGQVVQLRAADILRWRDAGPVTLDDIRYALAKLGLALKGETLPKGQ
jgi:DNA-directed RNA polymerase alpha subunit